MEQPDLRPVPETDNFRLMRDYPYSYNGGNVVIVPKGFIFNGASIPVIAQLITYTPFHPKIMAAALIHDYLYQSHEVSRVWADSIFYCLLIDNGVPKSKAEIMFQGVRLGGAAHYNKESNIE